VNQPYRGPISSRDQAYTLPWNGHLDTSSPKTPVTSNCPMSTIGKAQKKMGPAAIRLMASTE
jgi:hypothetical protein